MSNFLTAEEILIRSSNIGSVRIAQKIGIDKYKSFLKKIGILEKVEFDIDELIQVLFLSKVVGLQSSGSKF